MGREHYEMRFGGSGGQGMMLMGDVLAQAAGISEGREVVLLKSYGPEARGGACRSELIIDSGSINYPALTKPDFVLAMSQLACDSYTDDMDKENGALLVDEELVKNVPSDVKCVYSLPLTKDSPGGDRQDHHGQRGGAGRHIGTVEGRVGGVGQDCRPQQVSAKAP
jgi:2-oxoglutarate ferredoxin oxidoreductase subunit gamma